MARWILVGLDDPDVDVLTRIPKPHTDVLVVHTDPNALVLQLATLADMPTSTETPPPQSGDILITSSDPGETEAEWIGAWRDAGARVMTADAIDASLDDPQFSKTEFSEPEHVTSHAAEIPPVVMNPHELSEVTPSPEPTAQTPPPVIKEKNGDDPVMSEPPAEIWARPEDTFQYLIKESLGGSDATLWWDGDVGVWVPWVWTGDAPLGDVEDLDRGAEVPSSWGKFKLITPPGTEGKLNLAALARVAEDMALRDLATWNRTQTGLAGLEPPSLSGDLLGWASPVLAALDPETALLWRRVEKGWQLVSTWGDGVTFDGEFTVSDSMLGEMFAGADLDWHRWEPVGGVCVQIAVAPDDSRWELRSQRVMDVLKKRAQTS